MFEFIPFGMVAALPIGLGCSLLAKRKGRSARRWGLSMWALAAVWIAGAAALPSMAGVGGDRGPAMMALYAAAGCFLVQLLLAGSLVLSRTDETGPAPASRTRVAWLLAILAGVVVLSLVFAFVL